MADREIILRIILAVILGGVIGLEREIQGRAAGLRTHILVCVGSALITLTSLYIAKNYGDFSQNSDPSRIASGIVTGIGFLGAGTIIRSKASIVGLTTAASIWSVAGVGIALGCGFYKAAIYTAVAIIFTLFFVGWVSHKYLGKKDGEMDLEE